MSKENTYNFCVEFYQCGKDSDVYKAVESLKVSGAVDIELKASCTGITEPICKQQVWNGNHGIAQNIMKRLICISRAMTPESVCRSDYAKAQSAYTSNSNKIEGWATEWW